MKKLMLPVLGAAVLALAACGDTASTAPVSPAPTVPETQKTPDGTPGRYFELRLRGVDAQGYDTVLVPLRALQVTAGGTELPVRLAARTVDLATPDHAHLVGHFFVPEGVERVQIALTLDAFGGWERGGSAGSLDTRVAPLRFEAPVDALSQRGRGVVQLHVERSLRPRAGGERLLLPRFSVNY